MSTQTIAILILVGIFALAILLGFEISMAIFVACVVTILYLRLPITIVVSNCMNMASSSGMLAIPLFIIAGQILGGTSISDKLINFADRIIGWMRGGLSMANVVTSLFFGGMSGSPVADISAIGGVLIPRMEEKGYDRKFSTAVTMTSSLEGMMIPPSHNVIMYCIAAVAVIGSIDLSKALMAGIIPGLIMAGLMCIYCYFISKKRNYPKGEPFNLKELWKSFKVAIWGLLTLVIIIVGSLTGFCTATEAGAISIVWALIVSRFIYKELNLKKFWSMMGDCIKLLGRMAFLLVCASVLSYLFTYLRIPYIISSAIMNVTSNRILIFLIINLVLLLLGMFMDTSSLIIITTPIFLPICVELGMDPIQFGIMLILNLGIGMITPPIGAALFAGEAVSGVKVQDMIRELLPFIGLMVIVLLIVTFIPGVTMVLPNMMG